jgi:hypothetical protein
MTPPVNGRQQSTMAHKCTLRYLYSSQSRVSPPSQSDRQCHLVRTRTALAACIDA